MQVRSGHATGCSDEADLLTAFDGIADGDLGLAHMEVARDDSVAMVDVNDIARKKKLGDECDDASIGRDNGIAFRSAVVDAEVAAGHLAVEDASGSELARHTSGTRPKKAEGEQLRSVLCVMTDVSGEGVLVLDPVFGRRVEHASEFWVNSEATRAGRAPSSLWNWGRMMGILERRVQCVDVFGGSCNEHAGRDRVGGIDWNGAERLQAPIRGRAEVKRLARHRPCQAHNRVSVPLDAIDRQSNKGPNAGLTRLDDQTGLRAGGSRANERDEARCEQMMSERAAMHRGKLHELSVDAGNCLPRSGY